MFRPAPLGPNRSADWRRLLYLSYNAASDGGDRRDAHYAEFHAWLKKNLAADERRWPQIRQKRVED